MPAWRGVGRTSSPAGSGSGVEQVEQGGTDPATRAPQPLGIGNVSKVALTCLVILFQVLVMARDAAAAIAPGLIRSVRSLGGGEWAIYRHAVLPGMLPAIFTARRLSTGTAVAVLFFAETYATNLGLGAMIWDAWSARGYETMFAGVLAMALLGFGLYVVLDWLERLLCPWKAPAR